jgi:hypothetical protein
MNAEYKARLDGWMRRSGSVICDKLSAYNSVNPEEIAHDDLKYQSPILNACPLLYYDISPGIGYC